MNRFILIFSILSSMLLIGCDNKPKQKEMINACLFDPTGNCQRQAAAMAQLNAPKVLPVVNQAIAGGDPSMAGKVNVTEVNDALIKQTAAQVQAKIKADDMNPNSLHYDPPQSYVPRPDAASVEAARALPTQNQQVGIADSIGNSAAGADGIR